jgi:hypothetical protein
MSRVIHTLPTLDTETHIVQRPPRGTEYSFDTDSNKGAHPEACVPFIKYGYKRTPGIKIPGVSPDEIYAFPWGIPVTGGRRTSRRTCCPTCTNSSTISSPIKPRNAV